MFATVSLQTPVLDIEPFRTKLAAQRMEQPERDDDLLIALQKVCPVTGAKLGSMGQPVRAGAVEGRKIFLCCAGCEDKLAARPEYYVRRLSTVSDEGVLAVPEQAVIDTGNLKIIYVEREPGLFEGVAVTLGPLSGGFYPVIDGLLSGDRVAAAGSFLVDAETRLNLAAWAAYFGASGTPSSGGTYAPSTMRPAEDQSSGSSSGPSEKHKANLAKLPAADRPLAERQRVCPVTDLPLGSMGVPPKMDIGGTPLFICCEGCRGDERPAGRAEQSTTQPVAAVSRHRTRQPP